MARPRTADFDQRILGAASTLLATGGEAAVTMAAVADAAGVSRPSLYRRWPSRASLLFDLHTTTSVPPEMADLGSLRAELIAAVQHLAATMAAADRGLVSEQFAEMVRDRTFADTVWARRWVPDRDRVLVLWERAVTRGEVRSDAVGADVIDDLVAACMLRIYFAHLELDSAAVVSLVDRVLGGVLVPR